MAPLQRKLKVGIVGCTGAVGQRFIQLLEKHPWFVIHKLGASERSSGRTYRDALSKWTLPTDLPPAVAGMTVFTCEPNHFTDCDLVFSGLDSSVAGEVESALVANDIAVFSNAKNHRMVDDVPLVVPLVNGDHFGLITHQRTQRKLDKGFLVCNANCSTTGLVVVLKPLHQAFGIKECVVVTLQAISGAGYPGVSSMDITENIIPFISGEEDKLETEPLKILGRLTEDGSGLVFADFNVIASCNRVAVLDGHTESVILRFQKPVLVADVKNILSDYKCDAQRQGLPSAPEQCIHVSTAPDRPQPRLDRDRGNGYTVSVGRVRPLKSDQPIDQLCDGVQLTLLSHNTILGAAGSAILNAEMAWANGFIKLSN